MLIFINKIKKIIYWDFKKWFNNEYHIMEFKKNNDGRSPTADELTDLLKGDL